MHMFCYISEYCGEADKIETVLKDIVEEAKAFNKEHGVTGVLFFHNRQFLQVIEGEEANLRLRMEKIEKNDRHKNVDYLIDNEVESRGFQHWNMDAFLIGKRQKFDRDTMKRLTTDVKRNLAQRSDSLLYFYKTLLKQPIYTTASF